MEFEVKSLGELRVLGFMERQSESNNAIEKLWDFVHKENRLGGMLEINDGELRGPVGVCLNFAEDVSFDYCVGVATSKDFEGTVELHIEPAEYAVFSCTMGEIKDTFEKIYGGWIDTVDYEFTFLPNIEFYPDMNSCEIYVPVRRV